MALDRAPGLLRSRFGFNGWVGHDEQQWHAIRAEAEARGRDAAVSDIEIRGYDGDIQAVRRSQENIARLGLEDSVRIRCKGLESVARPTHRALDSGLVVVNPPWGERMGDADALPHLYNALGALLSREFNNWSAAVLTSELSLGKAMGLKAGKRHRFHNGRLELHCLQFELSDDNRFKPLIDVAAKSTRRLPIPSRYFLMKRQWWLTALERICASLNLGSSARGCLATAFTMPISQSIPQR